MNLTIANLSSQLSMHDLAPVVAAVRRQVAEHFQPEWGKSATLTAKKLAIGDHAAPIDGHHDAIIYLGDSSQDPSTGVNGAMGYHAQNHASTAYGFIYLDVCKHYGDPWSVALSHEVLELLADPTANQTVPGPAPHDAKKTVAYALEVCDPTQGDTYPIDGVTVSNFVGRAYFHQNGGSGKTNHLDLPLPAFGVRPKGYFQYTDGSQTHQINGPAVTDAIHKAKALMGKARRNARRVVSRSA
jgi:hypothetical protein